LFDGSERQRKAGPAAQAKTCEIAQTLGALFEIAGGLLVCTHDTMGVKDMRQIVLASLLVAVAAPALAQPAAAPPKEPPPQVDPVTTIVRIDTNHDGAASREEWVAYGNHDAGFTAIDTDKDGRLTVAELRVFRAKNAKTDAERAALTAENPKFDPALTILMADTNRDGAVSEAEWVAYGGHGGGGFAPMDANHDGKLTAEELAGYRNAHPPK
jgi:hypothetical protein